MDIFKKEHKSCMEINEVYFWTAIIYKWKHLFKQGKYKEHIIILLRNFDSVFGVDRLVMTIAKDSSCIYFFFETWSPGMVATQGNMNTFLIFSYCTLSGQDPTIEVSSLIKNISIFESIFANLYTVLIVGKLLSR